MTTRVVFSIAYTHLWGVYKLKIFESNREVNIFLVGH